MKLKEILDLAAEAYWDFPVQYDEKGQFQRGEAGDTLAEFIVAEIADTYSPGAGDYQQLSEAAESLSRAQEDLEKVWRALTLRADKEIPDVP